MDTTPFLTVKALTKYIKRKFDADPHLKDVAVKGEISNFKSHSSGHLYFTLKDEKARIMAVMFAASARSLKFRPENGMQVIITGDITVYESSGQYQMYVKAMQPDGIGGLFVAFEQLKQKLEQEGLFRREIKRALPAYPSAVAVITSPTGAAVRDIITTIKRRFPSVDILIYPALVQGDRAAASVAQQLRRANEDGRADVIIAGRGGGSIEELWAFNEEIVARAIRASRIPVISAVGHETDVTIADFAADLRAPTPTGAAEMAVPHIEEVVERIAAKENRLRRSAAEKVRASRNRYEAARNSYILRNPQALYRQQFERADQLQEQLVRNAKAIVEQKRRASEQQLFRLSRIGPERQMAQQSIQLAQIVRRLQAAAKASLTQKQSHFQQHISMLDALSPLKVMERGYSLTYGEDGKLLKSVAQAKKNDRVQVRLPDGTLHAKIESIGGNQNET